MLINTNLYNESTEDNVFSYINQINNNYNAIIEAKSIIEKIKSLFNKGSKAIDTKTTEKLVKKVNTVVDLDIVQFEMDGYDFKNIENKTYHDAVNTIISDIVGKSEDFYFHLCAKMDYTQFKIDDKLETMEQNRAKVLYGITKENRVKESERHQLLKDYFIGEKVKLQITKVDFIMAESDISHKTWDKDFSADKEHLTHTMNVMIKHLENGKNKIDYLNEEQKKEVIPLLNIHTEIVKSAYNDIMDVYAVLMETYALKIKQLNAICDRALQQMKIKGV